MSDITLSGSEMMPVLEMIEGMQEKGTFRSRVYDTESEQVGVWLKGVGSQLAVSKFLEQECQVFTRVDTRVYDDVSSDSGDLWKVLTNGSWELCNSVEIKKIPHYGNHVAITRSEAKQIDEGEPIIIVQCEWEENPPSDNRRDWLLDQEVGFTVAGWCTKDDLSWTEQGAKPWTQNDDNLCQPIRQLNTDWHNLCNHLHPDVGISRFTFTDY